MNVLNWFGVGCIALAGAAAYVFLLIVSVLLTVAFWAAVIYGVLWMLEAVFGLGLLSALEGAL